MLARISSFLIIFLTIAFCIKSLREPDLWWMFRTGEWILANGQVPKQDIFSYTHAGVEWVNVKWLFEVIITFIKNIGGAELVFILQAATTLGILFLSQKIYKLHQLKLNKIPELSIFYFVFLFGLIAIDFRLIARPEMCSHILTASFLYLFYKYEREKNIKILYYLIPLQALWANLHEGFGTGMVLMGAWSVGLWLNYFFDKNIKKEAASTPIFANIIVAIALLSVVLHPYGLRMLWHPYHIYTQLQDNKFTTELLSFTSPAYWNIEAYLNISFLVISLLGFIFINKNKEVSIFKNIFNNISPALFLLYGLLFYLSLTAYRNIVFFIIISLPFVVASVQAFLTKYVLNKTKLNFNYISIAAATVLYLGVITGIYQQFKNSKDSYGLQVLNTHNPTGAADFLIANKLEKQKTFSDYLTSSYLLWRLQPDFKTYIDLRDLDIFPTTFFQTFAEATVLPPSFDQQDSIYNFNQVVLYRPQFATLHQYLINSERYDLVFVDAVAAVYLKKNAENQPLIAQFGFKTNNKKDIFSNLSANQSSGLANVVSKIFNPLFSVGDNSDVNNDLLAGEFYKTIGETNLAIARAQKATAHKTNKWQAHELLGNIFNSELGKIQDPTQRSTYIQNATVEYDKALKINPKAANSFLGKGLLLIQQNQHGAAITQLKQAVEIENDNFQANKWLAFSYKLLYFNQSQSNVNLENWLLYAHKLDKLNPENPFITFDLGLAYCVKNKCKEANSYLQKVKNFPQFSPDEQKTLQDCLKKCGS